MNIRFELIHRVQAGDPVAAQTLVEHYQPFVFRIALSILDSYRSAELSPFLKLNDPNLDAADASREAFTAALNQIDGLSAAADFTAWLARLVVQTCQARIQRVRTRLRIEQFKRALLRRPAPEPQVPVTGRDEPLWQAFVALEERERLALVLRYEHHMLPQEIVLAVGGRERALQARLHAAREALWNAWARLQKPVQAASEHARFTRLIQSAADHQITDRDAAELEQHLKGCADCQASVRQFTRMEEAIEQMFHQRWDQKPAPAIEFSRSVFETHQRGHQHRNVFNLAGAALVTLVVVAVVVWLPNILPASPVPGLRQPTATPVSAPARAFQPRPTAILPPNDPALIDQIYPGRLTYSTGMGLGAYPNAISSHLVTMLPNGEEMFDVGVDPMTISSPAWSPDGKKIAYLGNPIDTSSNEIFVAQADGSGARQISPSSVVKNENETINATPQSVQVRFPIYGAPQWSPDGRYVAAPVWLSGENSSLVIFSPEGRLVHQLEIFGLDRAPIKWSPDGRFIAYVNESGSAVWLWNPNQPQASGTNPRRLDLRPTWDSTYGIDWSPDSRRIALLTGIDRSPLEINLFIARTDMTEYKVLPIPSNITSRGRIRNTGLAWSPDGRYLALNLSFRNSESSNNRLMVIQPDGNVLQVVATMDRGVRDITWSPDGRWLAFTSGFDIWAASMNAFERSQTYLVKLSGQTSSSISWQRAR